MLYQKKLLRSAVLSSVLSSVFWMGNAQAKPEAGVMVFNGNIASESPQVTGKNNAFHKGRVSALFSPSAEGLEKGRIPVKQFNVILNGVKPQAPSKKSNDNKSATLGFSISANQSLSYNAEKGVIEGNLKGFVNIPGYINPKQQPIDKGGQGEKGEGHVFVDPTQEAELKIVIKLQENLNQFVGIEKQVSFEGEMRSELVVAGEGKEKRYFKLLPAPIIVDLGWWRFEAAKNLCVQPVRIGKFNWSNSSGWPWVPSFSADYTGTGLPFGKPGAVSQWKKADVTFTWKQWKTIWNNQYWDFSKSESADLRGSVNDANCVEVFFVNTFQPNVFWGGGATYGSGTANAQIISTDQNVPPGVDLTHLAHEIGHAVSLCHPGSASCESRPEMSPGNSGTLMCPSGFNNDNPAINSEGNKDNVSNPLLTYSLKLVSVGTDCANNASCGSCY